MSTWEELRANNESEEITKNINNILL